MRKRCMRLVMIPFTAMAVMGAGSTDAPAKTPEESESIAFYYGKDIPEELLQVYERVVVEPDAIAQPARLAGRRARLVAYVSVGELADGAPTRPRALPEDWVIGRNQAWNSRIMDLTQPGWRRWLVDVRMRELWRQGYRGFFLDTLDSFHLAGLDADRTAAQIRALAQLVAHMHRRFPGAEILVNRGFEVLPQVAHLVHGVVAESLFDRWDAAAQRYLPVPEDDRRWLVARLEEARDRHGLPVTVIDYRPPTERAQARETARRIAALGFSPWVTNPALDMVGVGVPELLPRRVLVLYDGARERLPVSPALRLLAPVLEHEGYTPVFHDVGQPLPEEPLPGRYAGIATWFPGPMQEDPGRYGRWLLAQIEGGMRVAIFGHPGFDIPDAPLARMGLARSTRQPGPGLETRYSDMAGFEALPRPHRLQANGLIADDPWVEVHLRVADDRGPLVDPVVTAAWGGMALAPHLLEQGHDGALAWVIDPFAFVRAALDLAPVPVPDLTTENGRRLFMAHVAPEGARWRAELRGTPPAGSVVREIMARHRLPHTTPAAALAQGLAHVTVAEPPLAGPGARITRITPSLTGLVPSARPDGKGGLALLWPIADEDGYRLDAGGAPLGFRRVIETFERTDGTRRLAPVVLRYHAYTGATAAGRKALEQVYAWLAAQPLLPVLASEYADMVRDFHRMALARYPDGAYRVYGAGALRTLRLPPALGWPDLARSPAVAAVRDLPQGRYVSMDASASPRLVVTGARPALPLIVDSNARVLRFERMGPAPGRKGGPGDDAALGAVAVQLRLRGHQPVSVVIANLPDGRCTLAGRGFRVKGRRIDGSQERSQGPGDGGAAAMRALRFDLPVTDTGLASMYCRR